MTGMLVIRVLLSLMLAGLGQAAFGQELLWEADLGAKSASIVRASNGDVYVARIDYTPSVSVHADCYDGNGNLKSTSLIGTWDAQPAQVHSADLFGSTLYFVIQFEGWSRIVQFDTDSISGSSIYPQSAGSALEVRWLTPTFGNYCVIGERESDGAHVIQVRSQASGNVLREVVTSHRLSSIHGPVGGFYYVIGTYTTSGQNRFVVHRVSGSSNTQYSAIVSNIHSNILTTPLQGVLTSQGTLFLVSNYYNGVSTFNLFAIPFSIASLTFSNPWEENLAGTESYLRAQTALGANGLFLALHNRYVGLSNTGGLTFELNYPFAPATAFSGTAVTDANGSAVVLLRTGSAAKLLRIGVSGIVLNQHDVPVDGMLLQSVIDTAGTLRFTHRDGLSDHSLTALTQASLTLPGPYTIGGSPLVGTISIGGPAPTGGATFDLFSNNTAAVVPTSVTIPAGQSSVNFTITTTAVAANAKPTINARYNGIVLQKNFDLAAPLIQNIIATPQSQYGGVNIAGTVQLTGPAPTGGKVVTLVSSNTARATVPANVTVPAGATSANFAITTIPTLVNASSVITATTGAVSKTRFIAIVAPVLQTATLTSTTIKGGQSTTMVVTLGTPAPTGYTVTLLSGAPSLVQLPSSYAIPANSTTVNVPVLSSPVTSTIAVTLVAYRGPYIKVMTLTLTP